ncbi:MAG: DUF2059 domain-containing protein [Acidobacteriota bacterium]|nr:DUF2059 domain-containing protein [Acidobacteriota bacterium]
MRTRTVLLLSLICFSGYGQTVANTKAAKIEELFRLMKTDQIQKQVVAQISAAMDQEHRQSSSKFMSFLSEKMSWEMMKPSYVKLYDDTFTEEEISGILMFYESAPGQAYLAKMPLLMTSMMTMVQKRTAELKPEIEKLAKESSGK